MSTTPAPTARGSAAPTLTFPPPPAPFPRPRLALDDLTKWTTGLTDDEFTRSRSRLRQSRFTAPHCQFRRSHSHLR